MPTLELLSADDNSQSSATTNSNTSGAVTAATLLPQHRVMSALMRRVPTLR